MYTYEVLQCTDGISEDVADEILRFDRIIIEPVLEKAGMPFEEGKRRGFLADGEVLSICRDPEGNIVGYLECGNGLDGSAGDDLYITAFLVRPKYRKKLQILRIVANMMDAVRERAFVNFTCHVHKSNKEAMNLYRNIGFEFNEIEGNNKQFFCKVPKDILYSNKFSKIYSNAGKNDR